MKKSPFKLFKVSVDQVGMPLGKMLVQAFPGHSYRMIKRALDAKACFVNRKLERYASYALRYQDEVCFNTALLKEKKTPTLKVIFEDEFLIAYDKPPGLVCDDPMQIHRLDKETSGLYLVAKTQQAKLAFEELFMQRQIKKQYLGICLGKIQEKSKTIQSYLEDVATQKGKRFMSSSKDKRGKLAITTYCVRKQNKNLSFVECEIQTGRTHQIRVQLKELGHPILGDYHYAREANFPIHVPRHMLHSFRMECTHPFTNQLLKLQALPPKDFQKALQCVS